MKTNTLKNLGVAAALILATAGFASSAHAGRIALTGHDDDFHQSTEAKAQVEGMLSFVEGGSISGTVLTFDHGTELTSMLTSMGIAWVNVDPDLGTPNASLFDHTKYSAIMVASDTSCGGCDNTSTSSTNLAAASSSFASFFNAGGGIVGLAGASNTAYYNFLPLTALNPGIVYDSNGFSQTAAGAAWGIGAVNGDYPHNFFAGTDPAFKAMEVYNGPSSTGNLTDQPFTIAADGKVTCTGTDCTITPSVPEPSTFGLLAIGMVGLRWARRFKMA